MEKMQFLILVNVMLSLIQNLIRVVLYALEMNILPEGSKNKRSYNLFRSIFPSYNYFCVAIIFLRYYNSDFIELFPSNYISYHYFVNI